MKTKEEGVEESYGGFAERPQQMLTPEPGYGGVWGLREAKAQLSEVVRRAQVEGPQRVTVRGREDVYVVSGKDYHRLRGARMGSELVKALAESPLRGVTIERERVYPRVRYVEL